MRDYANSVSLKVEKTGGEAVVNSDMSVSIIMDGKIQQVIKVQDLKLVNNDHQLIIS